MNYIHFIQLKNNHVLDLDNAHVIVFVVVYYTVACDTLDFWLLENSKDPFSKGVIKLVFFILRPICYHLISVF